MKTVKKRTVSIIHELIGNEELMTLSELAEKFEVSQRTIRNDLKLINELLKEMDLGKIRLVGGRIICPSSFGQVLKAAKCICGIAECGRHTGGSNLWIRTVTRAVRKDRRTVSWERTDTKRTDS